MTRAPLTKKTSLCFRRGFFIALLVLALLSCGTNNGMGSAPALMERDESLYLPEKERILWQKITGCDFAEYFLYENKSYPIRYHCVRIDLSKKISVVTFPNSDDDFISGKDGRTEFIRGMTAETFSTDFDSLITVNAAPFEGRWRLLPLSSKRKIIGVHVAGKNELSKPRPRYGALALRRSGGGWLGKIFSSQYEDYSEFDFVFGGFFTILSDGKQEDFAWKSNDSRTAAGLSEDGKTLYLLVVEGEKTGESAGLSYPECARIMLALGASDAVQMDGGGSSSLFINKKNALSYSSLRKNAVFMGFK